MELDSQKDGGTEKDENVNILNKKWWLTGGWTESDLH